MSDRHATHQRRAAGRGKRVLFLAQTPPPHHGQSAIAAMVRDVLETDAGMIVDQVWRGGARSNKDVGRKTIWKYFAFLGMLAELSGRFLIGRRYEVAYLGMAPWAHTAFRDALVAGVAKLLSKRTWIHVHGTGLSELLDRPGLKGALGRRLVAGTEVVAITEEVCRGAARSGLFSRVLPLANMSLDPGDQPERRNARLTIACLGNLDPRKGVLDFVDIVSELAKRDVRVQGVIIGGATAQLDVEDVKRRAAEFGTQDRIEVTGWVSEERKSELLAKADVFLYLSRHDLAPVALIEALAHGCAPIVLDIGGLAEMVGPHLQSNVLEAGPGAAPLTGARQRLDLYLSSPAALARDKAEARSRYLAAYSPRIFRNTLLGFLAAPDRTGASPSKSQTRSAEGQAT